MITVGEYRDQNGTYGVVLNYTKNESEVILVTSGEVCSAYKKSGLDEYSFLSNKAREFFKILQQGVSGCKSKNGTPFPFTLGSAMSHEFTKAKVEYNIELFSGEVIGATIVWGNNNKIELRYSTDNHSIPDNIPYTKLTTQSVVINPNTTDEDDLNAVPVRSVEEIALEKDDITWLQKKKYYIVNDDATAESIFKAIDNWEGPVAYDTETTGLKINCFGKINSKYKKQLEEYNAEHPDAKIRADRLVGIIFCVEDDISYYFPCFNRKFRNLYSDNTPERQEVIKLIRERYKVKPENPMQEDMFNYFRDTPEEQWTPDILLMERVRHILETRHIVAHNGAFEYKVGCQYGIDTNLKDDTMIMHQIMYKFRTTTSNRGEPSNLKYLAKVELGIDQWELSDFFPDFKEDNSGVVRGSGKSRGKKKGSKIDFSYMDYNGTRVYAPTDGDVTFLLFKKYKADMIKNHKEQEYIYNVEIIVACCMGYMEFWGHRLDEKKVDAIRDQTKAEVACIESEIRQSISFADSKEIAAYNDLKTKMQEFKDADVSGDSNARAEANKKVIDATANLKRTIAENTEHELNLGSPLQVGELFYDILKYPMSGDKKSVAKKEIKPLLKAKNEDGTPTYPIAVMYSEYKNKETLLSKFFDSLQDFMFPGGLIFSSFGQISTATGRMSCSHPNAQQYPKSITKIVIPRDGYIVLDADYSQIEYRVLTALAGNEYLADLFKDPDSDYHTLMASLMYGVPYESVTPKQRGDAKSFNFGIPYGMGMASLAILLTGNSKPSSIEEAKEKYELYFKNQPKTRKFFDTVKEMAQINGYTKTHWGRYRYYSFTDADGNVNNAKKAAALRQAGNAIIQGCVSAGTKIQTKEYGIVNIEDVVDKHLLVWNGENWTNGDILYSGKKRKCIITFGNGQRFICSDIHKFSITNTDEFKDATISDIAGTKKFIECKNLCSGMTVETDGNNGDVVVESVEITDEYIDMYDVCNTDEGYYVADGLITHNTAADVFKISVARNFMYIRENHLLGQMLIINMIHDEQLFEIDVQHLNAQMILADIGRNMQFKVEGFPPLYIGAGVGPAWGEAKGKMAEIHPLLLEQMTKEAETMPIKHEEQYVDTKEVLKYFANRVLQFRINKVKDYITNPENYGKALHPVIGNLINLQFTYGHTKDEVGLDDKEFTLYCLDEFIKHENVEGVTSAMFIPQETQETPADDEDENDEYTDGDEDELDLDEDIGASTFTLIDESNVAYGATIQDLIHQFRFFASPKYKICGLDAMDLNYKKKDELVDYLTKHICEPDDDGAMEIVFLQAGNILNRTGMYVNNLNDDELQEKVGI
ncbi:MAG: hypothetical protein IJ593_08515 [Lachnospiraceae bacterium]|nr:hypothetical protein [Lachnospiraceae bacterium]